MMEDNVDDNRNEEEDENSNSSDGEEEEDDDELEDVIKTKAASKAATSRLKYIQGLSWMLLLSSCVFKSFLNFLGPSFK